MQMALLVSDDGLVHFGLIKNNNCFANCDIFHLGLGLQSNDVFTPDGASF